jgi:hypothetical protein
MFQNLRENDPVYVIDRSRNGIPELKIGKVKQVGRPMPATPTQTSGLMMGMNQQYEVTLHAVVDNKEGDFPHLPTTATVHDYGSMVVAETREAALSEIDKMRMKSQGELDRQDINEQTVAACEEMSKVLNPTYAKEQERDAAISKLGSRLDNLESGMAEILEHIKNNKK